LTKRICDPDGSYFENHLPPFFNITSRWGVS
jgi:hypothetical protein